MSRIGKQIIAVPAGVEISINGNNIKVKGPKGELEFDCPEQIKVVVKENNIQVTRKGDEPEDRSLHGLTRALVNNMVIGVSDGFQKKLEIIGVGYRAQVSGKKLTLNLGFSHPVELTAPEGIDVKMDEEQKNTIVISGVDKQVVGQFAAIIRKFRPPEPYKGKGIRYSGEYVPRKSGKAAAGGKDK
ncbi:50S ribosomal protein L6 [Candidatus Peregrinibacteria bacterium]|nr:50S ribosomal protein L6 [Candidatus Peregrinibacteria bacterium]